MSRSDNVLSDRWLLPDGVEEILPPRARRIELLRRALLDEFDLWGYELVMPPLIEYLESLLVGVGSDLDLQTFKVTDQLSGRMMGVRADITSQAARIDAHSLVRSGPTRLCYAATVLRTRPEGLLASRSPLKLGAELYGVDGTGGDAEVISLMLRVLELAAVGEVTLELGHVGIFRGLAAAAGLDDIDNQRLFAALQSKAKADVAMILAGVDGPAEIIGMLGALVDWHGDASVLAAARERLTHAPAGVLAALDDLEAVATRLAGRHDGLNLRFDLAEVHGYAYHTGIVFSAYVPQHGQAIARGGRYDDIGAAFGRARPATGFDTDLKTLADLGTQATGRVETVLAPDDAGLEPARAAALWSAIRRQREAGRRVIVGPAEQDEAGRRLEWDGGDWTLR